MAWALAGMGKGGLAPGYVVKYFCAIVVTAKRSVNRII